VTTNLLKREREKEKERKNGLLRYLVTIIKCPIIETYITT